MRLEVWGVSTRVDVRAGADGEFDQARRSNCCRNGPCRPRRSGIGSRSSGGRPTLTADRLAGDNGRRLTQTEVTAVFDRLRRGA